MVSFGTSPSFLNFYEQCLDNLCRLDFAVRSSVLSINNPCQKIYACHLAAQFTHFLGLGHSFSFSFSPTQLIFNLETRKQFFFVLPCSSAKASFYRSVLLLCCSLHLLIAITVILFTNIFDIVESKFTLQHQSPVLIVRRSAVDPSLFLGAKSSFFAFFTN
jgi:hypothetical protein